MQGIAGNHTAQDKLLLLYLLWKAGIWLGELQIVQVMTELAILNYFVVKSTLATLTDDGLIEENHTEDMISYRIREEGRKTIETLQTEIRKSLRYSIKTYIEEHRTALQEASRFRAYFLEEVPGHYKAHLEIYSGGTRIFELVLQADSRTEAKRMLGKWRENAVEIYQSVLASLC